MDKDKRKALEKAGFQVGDAEDFLGLTDEERRIMDLRLRVGRCVRQLREAQNLTQNQLAERMKSSQSRIAKLEAGSPGVSLNLLFRGFFALGGDLTDLVSPPKGRRSPTRKARKLTAG